MKDDGMLGIPHPGEEADQRNYAATRYRNRNINLMGLWTYYYGIGGNADELVLDAYLHEMMELPPLQMDLVHTAIEEITAEGL
jgi:hypothetical protein